MTGHAASVGAVRRLVDAAAEIAHDSSLIARLAASTALSPEGVKLALQHCLERDATEAEIEALVRRSASAPRVHVILSANVFTAALRAIAVARASASVVTVRPSRREPAFARALVEKAADPGLSLAEALDVTDVRQGEIHVYGRDDTIDAVRRSARPGVRVRAHGAGLGVAFVGEGGELERAARAIADDVILFDQRGCLSPRLVLVQGDRARGEELARCLHVALEDLATRVPRGALDDTERRDAVRYAETMAFAGRLFRGEAHLVGAGEALVVPPAGRHVHVVTVRDLGVARLTLAPVLREVVAIGCDDESEARALAPDARVRLSRLGWMQRPRLDGPVDLR